MGWSMRNSEILILAGAAALAFWLVNRAKAAPAAATTQQGTLSSSQMAWYLNDIYSRMNAGLVA